MRLNRVYVDAALESGTRCTLQGSAANHVVNVLRLRSGDALTLFNGRGGEYAGRIDSMRKDIVVVEVGDHDPVERESPLHLTLAQGISRGERMDLVMQKATELGVSKIIPLLTERTVVRLDARQAERKLQHWRAITVAACEQCGRNRVPQVVPPMELGTLLTQPSPGATRVLLSPGGTRRPADLDSANSVLLLIGPEGGLSGAEQRAALEAGFEAVSLGPRVLRTETAAIAALAAFQQRFGDF